MMGKVIFLEGRTGNDDRTQARGPVEHHKVVAAQTEEVEKLPYPCKRKKFCKRFFGMDQYSQPLVALPPNPVTR